MWIKGRYRVLVATFSSRFPPLNPQFKLSTLMVGKNQGEEKTHSIEAHVMSQGILMKKI
jgi:hypothetical protein